MCALYEPSCSEHTPSIYDDFNEPIAILEKNQFYFIESATSCHCGRLRSYRYIGTNW